MATTTNNKKERLENFDEISLKLASPDRILDWSYGEVTKPETINYRTGRSERGGLFDERIFGPEKDYECYCGKYKRIRYRDIICEKCGVEVTRSIVRRERMGHIELSSPVAHIWFLRGIPTRIGMILDLSVSNLEKVIYFAGYIITSVNDEERKKVLKNLAGEYKEKIKALNNEESKDKLKEVYTDSKKIIEGLTPWQVIDEVTYHKLSLKYGTIFEAGIGAEAVYNIFKEINIKKMLVELEERMEKASSVERARLQRRHNIFKAMGQSNIRPEWMFLTILPVIPPGLRPMVALDGGRHATSDVNDLYRRVINRNNRLKKLIDLRAPEIILRNEKRILQEAVDALIDNSIRKSGSDSVMNQTQRRPLKSLADSLKGKQGRFRQNLLGKRVDYSGRSVIVVGPTLKLYQCGLPKQMALELFRPFVIAEILQQELAYNIRGAGRLIDEGIAEVWAILEEVIRDKYVLLNRAPTLHRLGIQAFQPILIEGKAIQVHPLVCTAFNADFDGDQMAVHVPLGVEAQREAREIIASNNNILKPGSGDPVVNMKLDIVLGCYWVTKDVPTDEKKIKSFGDPNSAIMAYDFDDLELRQKINLLGGSKDKYKDLLKDGPIETTVGRILFNNMLPSDFPYLNEEINGKEIARLVEDLIEQYGIKSVSEILDKIKTFGFKYATISGITWGIDDVVVPEEKRGIIVEARAKADLIEEKFNEGLLSENERYRMIIETWTGAKDKVIDILPKHLDPMGPVSDMLKSNARGSIAQISQMAGMKGLIQNPSGKLLDFPIIPSYKEGLSPLEYFKTTHGSRKTLADTALNTAKAGYMTRKLVDVAQDIVVTEKDCKDKEGKYVSTKELSGFEAGIAPSIRGRILAADLKDGKGKVVLKKGHLVTKEEADLSEEQGAEEATVRSPLSCKTLKGICQTCYGIDPGRGLPVALGEAVGIVAAQAIGEPGTQLTMRTKHSGGVDTGGDIVGGLPRVEEVFERRNPKNEATVAGVSGAISDIKLEGKENIVTVLVDIKDRKKGKDSIEYAIPVSRTILVKVGDAIEKGQILTDGSANLQHLFKYASKAKTEDYIISQINHIYQLQGVSIAKKHIEIIIRQMFSRRKVKTAGDTKFLSGETLENQALVEENRITKENGGEEAVAEQVILGITETALTTESFLSSASFQHTNRILIDTAVRGGVDKLRGLKENVIVGRLIPAGTGLREDFEEKEEGGLSK